jgi:hypothetical protein
VVLDLVCAEAALEKIDDSGLLELTRLDLDQVVSQREQAEAGPTELPESLRHLRMSRHRREPFDELLLVGLFDAYRSCAGPTSAARPNRCP